VKKEIIFIYAFTSAYPVRLDGQKFAAYFSPPLPQEYCCCHQSQGAQGWVSMHELFLLAVS